MGHGQMDHTVVKTCWSVFCCFCVCVWYSQTEKKKKKKAEKTGVERRVRENLVIYEIEAAAEQKECF